MGMGGGKKGEPCDEAVGASLRACMVSATLACKVDIRVNVYCGMVRHSTDHAHDGGRTLSLANLARVGSVVSIVVSWV